jgi:uncharacterized protein YbcV (DUF1398 family)
MFTIDQIAAAHAKVKSGADFPNYAREIMLMGVRYYETHVVDGQTDYYGEANYKVAGPPKYAQMTVAPDPDADRFKADLLAHQQGQTDYPTFIADCARSGIEKWIVSFEKKTCTYYDSRNNIQLVESIPI